MFIEHPECLTSEDTAQTVSQNSNDRHPFAYRLEELTEPVSEEMFEFISFPEESYRDAFKEYIEFMNNTQYIDDGNPQLVEKELINEDDSSLNEQPLYITNYHQKFGKYNDIVENNKNIMDSIDLITIINSATTIEINQDEEFNFNLLNAQTNLFRIIFKNSNGNTKELFITTETNYQLILKFLDNKYNIIYYPINYIKKKDK